MEPEFKFILRWTGPASAEAPGASTQWGHSITIFGNPKRITGSRRKSFMAGMYGFETDGELAAVCNYLRNHGSYEIEQVLCFCIRFSVGGCHTLLGLLVGCDQSSDWSLVICTSHLTCCLMVTHIVIHIFDWSSNWSLVICTGRLTCCLLVTYIDIHILPCTLLSQPFHS